MEESPVTVQVDNELSASTRLTFFENLLIGQERECRLSVLTGARIKRVQFPLRYPPKKSLFSGKNKSGPEKAAEFELMW